MTDAQAKEISTKRLRLLERSLFWCDPYTFETYHLDPEDLATERLMDWMNSASALHKNYRICREELVKRGVLP